jgi:hypothetical protein
LGEPDNSQPFSKCQRAFLFFEKEGFFKTFVVLVLGRRKLEKK